MSLRRMSARILSTVLTAVLCSVFIMSLSGAALAQQQGGFGNLQTRFPVQGLNNILVVVGGSLPKSQGGGCPFENTAWGGANTASQGGQGYKAFETASNAAKLAGDEQGCPFYIDPITNGKEPLKACANFYDRVGHLGGKVNKNIVCCHKKDIIDPQTGKRITSWRSDCMADEQAAPEEVKQAVSEYYLDTCTTPLEGGMLSDEQIKECEKKKKDKKTAQQQCMSDAMDRIGQYWENKKEVRCFNAIKNSVKSIINKELFELTKSSDAQLTTALANLGWTNVGSALATAKVPFTIAARAFKIASDADKLLTQLNDGCAGTIPAFRQLQNFRDMINNNLSCQAVMNLVERQLTQCIRVNLSFDLRMPQYNMLLQCPLNLNLNVRADQSGFRCYTDASVGSPVSGSIMSGNGGLKKLFDGDCFGGTKTGDTSGDSSGGDAGTEIPGVDCGPLDSGNIVKKGPLQGKTYLAAGSAANGWAIGGTEKLPQIQRMQPDPTDPTKKVPVLDANGKPVSDAADNAVSVTRCDYFEKGRILRTAYVYGSGASCNSTNTGFKESGFETNTACYGNAYTPASLPNVPAACLYPPACLNTGGEFDQNLAGKNGCPTGVKPTFNAAYKYFSFTSGGFGGGVKEEKSCADFDGAIQPIIQCCDPQVQNCATNKDANVPLCVCDYGDANNTVVSPTSSECSQGGNVTCCSPRLNGQDWCDKSAASFGLKICADEKGDQCVPGDTAATYFGMNGTQQDITASKLVLAKPSPYVYLFVRPDAKLNGQQCCTTEWCNICPQHYANAYGLSMKNVQMLPATSDAENDALIGKGWPFIATTNETTGETTYNIGITHIEYRYKITVDGGGDGMGTYRTDNLPLQLATNMSNKPAPNQIDICNRLPGYAGRWKVGFTQDGNNMQGEMGYVYNWWQGNDVQDREEWHTIGGIPAVNETPLAYLNRYRNSIKLNGKSLESIPLCGDIASICYPGTGQTPVTNPTTPMTTPAPVFATPAPVSKPVQPVVDVTPAPVTNTTGGGGGIKKQAEPSEIPSVTGGQASGSLY